MNMIGDMMTGFLIILAVAFLYISRILAEPVLFIQLAFSDLIVFVTVILILSLFTGGYYGRMMGSLGIVVASYYRVWGVFLGMAYTVLVMS